LDADAAVIHPGSNQCWLCFSAVFIVLGLIVGRTPKANPLQKNQLAAPPRCCFCCAGAVLYCFYYWVFKRFYCCCARDKAEAVPVF
jgi:hypothetical protein